MVSLVSIAAKYVVPDRCNKWKFVLKQKLSAKKKSNELGPTIFYYFYFLFFSREGHSDKWISNGKEEGIHPSGKREARGVTKVSYELVTKGVIKDVIKDVTEGVIKDITTGFRKLVKKDVTNDVSDDATEGGQKVC